MGNADKEAAGLRIELDRALSDLRVHHSMTDAILAEVAVKYGEKDGDIWRLTIPVPRVVDNPYRVGTRRDDNGDYIVTVSKKEG